MTFKLEQPLTIGEKGNNQKGEIPAIDIRPETIELPSIEYGTSQNNLDANVAIRNLATVAKTGSYNDLTDKPSGSLKKIGYFTITATGSKAITGVGFTPSMVQFFYTNQAGGSGAGGMDGTSQFGHDYMGSGSSTQSYSIYLRDSGGTLVCRAAYTSMDADGFTLNVDTNSGTNRVDYIAFA